VIAARGGVLLMVAVLIVFGFRSTAPDLPPSTLRVVVAAVVGLLAPLFWPGIGISPSRTARRVAAWSLAASAVAAITLVVLGNPVQPVAKILETCAMLLPIVLLTHALAAVLEGHWRRAALAPEPAREMAGRAVVLLLALLGGLPLWLGPLGETLSPAYPGAVDALVAASPLTHLAVASGNDLLRNPWLYQHSNLAALPVSYPGLAELAWSYGAACALMAGAALAWVRRAGAAPPTFHPEITP
jgi:hypothetical protein